jgi:glycosyltransferase involved in cell wall biosynthesis
MYLIGAFGLRDDQRNGQTVKTRLFTEAVTEITQQNVCIVDTSDIRSQPHRILYKIFRAFATDKTIFVLPAQRGIKYLLPLYLLLKALYRNDVRYVVIGGWLPGFIETNMKFVNYCAKLEGIYIETENMTKALKSLGLNNVQTMPNFRSFDYADFSLEQPTDGPLSLVFFSRVMKTKGIELAIEAIANIERLFPGQVTLDIYGDIREGYHESFMQLVNETSPIVKYCGFLSPEPRIVYSTLSRYDAMVFPTFYEGEGFPGVVIDAFIAGVPVVASDWRYNREFITDNVTGRIFCLAEHGSLENVITHYITHREALKNMRSHCLLEAKKYRTERVVGDFLLSIGLHPGQVKG